MIHVREPETLGNLKHAPAAYDALVIGGGPAGCALAISLAESGRSVALIEKSAAAHPKVCGEFLSHEALHYLEALSIDPVALGAIPIEYVRLVSGTSVSQCRLPFRAFSLSRECLDEALIERARSAGAVVIRGRRARSLAAGAGAWSAQLQGGEEITGRAGFVATGKHDLHGWNRPAGVQNDLVAFKMYFKLASTERRALGGCVELILFPGGYAGLQTVEGSRTNLCLLVTRAKLREVGSNWRGLLDHMLAHSAHLAARLKDAVPLWAAPLSVSGIPYGLVAGGAPESGYGPAPWRLGDQAAVIPSFSGDGMSIALHSAALAAEVFCGCGSADDFQRRLAKQVGRQVGRATTLSRLLIAAPRSLVAAAWAWPGLLARVGHHTRIRRKHLLPRVPYAEQAQMDEVR